MSPTRGFRAALAILLVAAACSEESATSVTPLDAETPADLAFAFPFVTAETLIPTEFVESVPPSGPAAGLGFEDPDGAFAEIFGEITRVGFAPDYAYASGHHKYSGNRGRVETTARVSFQGQEIGSQGSARQEYTPFLFDFGVVKEIWTEAFIFIDRDCGLRANGDSRHFADWQWFLGGPAPEWGGALSSSQAFPPVDQEACQKEEEKEDDGGGSISGGDPDPQEWDVMTCWYMITFDLISGDIYDVQLLYCESILEGEFF